MKKIVPLILIAMLLVPVVVVAPTTIPAADKAKDNAVAPENSPVIEVNGDEDWKIVLPYTVKSDNPILKALFGVRHEFPGVFTTELTPTQVEFLNTLGVETEPVQLYSLLPPNKCGDGICQGFESPETCPEDCTDGGGEEPPPERACYPSTQTPWGIVKVNGGSGGAGVDVAVLDTGVYKEHLDLASRVEQCVDFTGGGPPGTVRIREGKCDDKNGHGTHVAGTVAADGGADGLGIFGVAPEADIFAYKVCTESGCWTDDIAAAIDYAASHGAEIVSMSLGGDSQSSLIKDAIDRNPGVLYVAAAGNDRQDGVGSIDYPGAYVKVIAVAAFDSTDAMASFSSLGVNDGDWVIEGKEIEFAAPGVNVESTWSDGCYNTISGTSMSTPHVSGIAARDWQGTASDTRTYLQELARYYTENVFDYGQAGDDIEAGFGLPIAA